jgi:hypothetical protein
MSKNKIADSIIIRVGGGIREVRREPVKVAANLESAHQEHGLEEKEDVQRLGVDLASSIKKIVTNKIIN